jgi:hypothetical protein
VRVFLPLALLGYVIVALAQGWWLSAAVAPVVAWLLWRRHRRARFTAYIYLSVLVARAALIGSWPLAAFALGVIGVLQLPAARRVWPRIERVG